MNAHRFEHFVAIDWSGAKGPRQRGIAVACCTTGQSAPQLVQPDQVWSRQEVVDWLLTELPPNSLVGMDLSPSLPFADRGAYFPDWEHSPPDAASLWQLVEQFCSDDPHLAATSFVDHPEVSRHFRRHGGRTGDQFGTGAGRFRVVEVRQRGHKLAPYSCMNLVGAAQVGKSSLTGMRVINRLRGRIPFWPFDPIPAAGSLLVEIYTSLAAREAGLPAGRSKITDAAALDAALHELGSDTHSPLMRYSDHATDAILSSAWLRHVSGKSHLWQPKGLEEVARTEGWTFGIV